MTTSEPRQARSGRAFLLAALAIVLVVVAVFSPVLLGRWTLLSFDERAFPPFSALLPAGAKIAPQNLITTDLQGWILGDTEISMRRLAEGSIPLWDSNELLGRPLHATISFPTFYFPDWIHGVLGPVRGYAASMALHLIWMGLGALFLLRREGCSSSACLIGALAFAFSGWTLVHLHIPHFIRSAACIPWMLLACGRLAERPTWRRAAQLGLCTGMLALCAFPPVMGPALFLLACWALREGWRASKRRDFVKTLAAAVAGGALLGAVQILPLLELRGDSTRGGAIRTSLLERKSLHAVHCVSLLAPDFQGQPVRLYERGLGVVERDWPVARELFPAEVQDNYVEDTLYCGSGILLLAVLGLVCKPGRRGLWFALFVGLGVAFAFPGPLQRCARAGLIPGFASGSPKRALILAAFAWPALAAFGFDRLTSNWELARNRAAGVALAMLALLVAGGGLTLAWLEDAGVAETVRSVVEAEVVRAFLWPAVFVLANVAVIFLLAGRRATLCGLALVALNVGELCWFGVQFNPPQRIEARSVPTPSIEFLRESGNEGRVIRHPSHELMAAPLVARFGVRSVDGLQPLVLREVAELLEAFHPGVIDPDDPWYVGSFSDPSRLKLPLLRLLARWIVANVDLQGSGFVLRKAFEAEGLGVFEVPGALPDAFVCSRVEVIADPAARLARLTAVEFDPATIAVLESETPGLGASHELDPSRPPAKAVSTRIQDGRWSIEVDVSAPGILVVTEAFHDGWHAMIDAETAPLLRVDHTLLGLALLPGRHRIELTYAPTSFTIGSIASSISAIALLLALILGGRQGSLPSPNSAVGSR